MENEYMDKGNMNAWKNLLEQDKLKGEIYDEKIKKEERNNYKKENNDQDEKEGARERLGSGEEFLTCQPNQKLTLDEKKKVINSVKLTKALVLLGYNCWSELEPGITFGIIRSVKRFESNDLIISRKNHLSIYFQNLSKRSKDMSKGL